jgi:DNA invertase Pin-like site-specific DNA recombinase
MKAFGYVRVSGKGQMNGDGPERQELAIKAYAKANGIELVRLFVEDGVSGTIESLDRPAWSELTLALLSNGTRAVIIEKLDRLARDLMVQESAIAHMKKEGFELLSTQEPDLCSEDPTRVLFRQMMGAFAQYEKNQIVIKLRAARKRKKAQTGKNVEGAKPFGFYEGEVAVLDRMSQLRAEGLGFDKIAATLNAEGMPTRKASKRWHGFAVNQILSRSVAALGR